MHVLAPCVCERRQQGDGIHAANRIIGHLESPPGVFACHRRTTAAAAWKPTMATAISQCSIAKEATKVIRIDDVSRISNDILPQPCIGTPQARRSGSIMSLTPRVDVKA